MPLLADFLDFLKDIFGDDRFVGIVENSSIFFLIYPFFLSQMEFV